MVTNEKTLGLWALTGAFAVILYFCFRIMEPFLMPVFLALILSTLLTPLYETLSRRLRNRQGLAALLICVGITLAIALPVLLLSVSLAHEANDVYERFRSPETSAALKTWLNPATNPLMARIRTWLPQSMRFADFDIGSKIEDQAQTIVSGILKFTTTLAAGVINFLMDYVIMVVVLFFMLRDSGYFGRSVRQISPLSEAEERLFVERFRVVTQATVVGNVATAAAQGTLSSLIFLVVGLPNPILWGALTALLSLVPVLGTALVWAPWTIYLFSAGSTGRAITFMALQVVLVGGIDNILRPLLIEGRVKMHTLVVFFSILGGIGYFGILGIFIGPLVFAIAIAFVDFYRSRNNPTDNGIPATTASQEHASS